MIGLLTFLFFLEKGDHGCSTGYHGSPTDSRGERESARACACIPPLLRQMQRQTFIYHFRYRGREKKDSTLISTLLFWTGKSWSPLRDAGGANSQRCHDLWSAAVSSRSSDTAREIRVQVHTRTQSLSLSLPLSLLPSLPGGGTIADDSRSLARVLLLACSLDSYLPINTQAILVQPLGK